MPVIQDVLQSLQLDIQNFELRYFYLGPVEIDTSGQSSHTVQGDNPNLNHSLSQTSMHNRDNTSLLSTATTSNGEVVALPAHLASSRPTSIQCLEGAPPENLLMAHPGCLTTTNDHLEDPQSQAHLIAQNQITSNPTASFLSYSQDQQGNSIGIGTICISYILGLFLLAFFSYSYVRIVLLNCCI